MRPALFRFDTQHVRVLTPFSAAIFVAVLCSMGAIGAHRLNADVVAAAPVSQGSAETAAPESAVTQPQPEPLPSIESVSLPPPAAVAPPPPNAVASLPAAMAFTAEPGKADPAKARALLEQMNRARIESGLAPLQPSRDAETVAAVRARDLFARGYFDHFAPDGASAFSELAARGIIYDLAGENLARNTYQDHETVTVAYSSLMASPGHRANILEPRFSKCGVVAIQSGRTWLFVMVFLSEP